ncbi:MAG: palindromic element RPE1 domain-containing protein, partial [Rickettsiaceae bacterium]|nr:palindromic element RPE1 domain-containing protein [Rickettsiaceae bacterium]MDD9336991.1 palindromic element RPE1 domain-containing protein [Rickettsiaceae bacterium]
AAYSNVREDSSTASTYKSPAEVEFRRRSTIKIAADRLLVRSRWKR